MPHTFQRSISFFYLFFGAVIFLFIPQGVNADGNSLYSFGRNSSGLTGLGTTTGNTIVPTLATTSTGWTSLSTDVHALGIKAGQLYSWGPNSSGKTGLGITAGSTLVPTLATTTTGWTAVAAGSFHSLGIKDGQLYGWGSNSDGATGLGTTVGDTLIPTLATTTTGWTNIATQKGGTSGYFSLGIKDGQLYSWGANTNGRGGRGAEGAVSIPTLATTTTGWTAVAAGFTHALAIKDGQLYAFGQNGNATQSSGGQTGLGLSTGDTLVPTLATTTTGWTAVVAGSSHSMGIKDGQLYGWGSNESGKNALGLTTGNTLVPTLATTTTGWTAVTTTSSQFEYWTVHSLGIRSGQLYSWGPNSNGKTGLGTIVGTTLVPTVVGSFTDWQNVSTGYGFSLATRLIPISAPTISLGSPSYSSVTGESATLSASIDNTGGEDASSWGFHYGTTTDYGNTVSDTGTIGATSFSLSVSSLSCGTQYFFRAFAQNSAGQGVSSGTSLTTSACPVSAPEVSRSSGTSAARKAMNIASMATPTSIAPNVSIGPVVSVRSFVLSLVQSGLIAQDKMEAALKVIEITKPKVFNFSRNLSLHDFGSDVGFLQRILIAKGYLEQGSDIGIFGLKTFSALKEYQIANGILPTGHFGPLTRATMEAQ